jgi:hypothetical protein
MVSLGRYVARVKWVAMSRLTLPVAQKLLTATIRRLWVLDLANCRIRGVVIEGGA